MNFLASNQDVTNKTSVLVIGANGAIGSALTEVYDSASRVTRLTREYTDYQESSLAQLAKDFSSERRFQHIVCCIGTLHDQFVQPEKSFKQVNADFLQHYFYVNSILPMLVIKHFLPLLDKKQNSCFACLSAMVGSTQDNRLGGWYGYRASKAALNSLIKTASIELRRSNENAALVAIHPGTTRGDLSAPFAKKIKPEKYYTPQQSAQRIKAIMESVEPEQTGSFFNWDGSIIPW